MNTPNKKKFHPRFFPTPKNPEKIIVYFKKNVPIDFLRKYFCFWEKTDMQILDLHEKLEIFVEKKDVNKFRAFLESFTSGEPPKEVVADATMDCGRYLPENANSTLTIIFNSSGSSSVIGEIPKTIYPNFYPPNAFVVLKGDIPPEAIRSFIPIYFTSTDKLIEKKLYEDGISIHLSFLKPFLATLADFCH